MLIFQIYCGIVFSVLGICVGICAIIIICGSLCNCVMYTCCEDNVCDKCYKGINGTYINCLYNWCCVRVTTKTTHKYNIKKNINKQNPDTEVINDMVKSLVDDNCV